MVAPDSRGAQGSAPSTISAYQTALAAAVREWSSASQRLATLRAVEVG